MQDLIKKICFVIISSLLRVQVSRLLRRNPQLIVIGVTGSVGKTTTKLAIAEVLRRRFKVQAHPGNYNTETGVPLSLFEMESPGSVLAIDKWAGILLAMNRKLKRPFPYDAVVLELGASKANDIAFFEYLKPHFGVVVAAKPAHVEGFGSVDTIVEEKFKLAKYSQQALVNIDEDRLRPKLAELHKDKLTTYGTKPADCWFEERSYDPKNGFTGIMHLRRGDLAVVLHLTARHNIHAAVAAAAIGEQLGLDDGQIKSGLEAIRPVNGRMNPLPGKNGARIIDDSYNANPEAVIAALETLYSLDGQRKIAVLGGMNELGPGSVDYHQEVGSYMGRLDLLVTVAAFAKQYIPAAQQAGLAKSKICSFDSPYQAGDHVASLLQPGDVVLVKGSQGGIFSEEVTAKLLANPGDVNKLVRQSPFWHGVKAKTFDKSKATHED